MKPCRAQMAALFLCALFVSTSAHAQGARQRPEPPLTNKSVVELVRAGFSEKAMIAIVRSRPAQFDLSPARLIELKRSGVSEKIILAMLSREEGAAFDDWNDDSFFDDKGETARSTPPAKGDKEGSKTERSDPNELNIFGSSGGVKGRTRSRGGSGEMDNDTQTVGSATVRIIRPPAESGGAPPRLERTPTLTNDSVIELVEAGFSEGTIIRRIEQSPAEFDLSPPRLAELRKRRVSERVIAAMRTAMGAAEASTSKSAPEK
jgi:hypothetical protein